MAAPKHKIVYFALSQLLVGILRLFKVLIRTLGQGAHILMLFDQHLFFIVFIMAVILIIYAVFV